LQGYAQDTAEQEAARIRVVEQNLVRKIPQLGEKETAPKLMQGILDVGREYGFSDADLAQYFDDRAYKMAYDLKQAREALAKMTSVKDAETGEKPKRKRGVRRMRAGNTSAVASQKARRKTQIKQRAVANPTPDNVIASMLVEE
jgi:hypothetical protein